MKESLIEIYQDRPGFNGFIGCWVCEGDLNLLVDVGPAKSVKRLLDSLAALGLTRIDYVLLTHIHLDHAGGLADVLEQYPMARVICHEKAVAYLVEPSKLWAGSLKALGEVAQDYGAPRPVELKRLIPHTRSDVKDITVIETPGHAAHHLSFQYMKRIFAGEAGGNFLRLNTKDYLRPATPPRLFLDVFLQSVDRLLQLENQPIRYAHFGEAESSHFMLSRFLEQLLRWKEIISAEMDSEDSDLVQRCVDTLLEKDPLLEGFGLLDGDSQNRERFFMSNSVRGFVGFLKK